jgi:hypothetical protein
MWLAATEQRGGDQHRSSVEGGMNFLKGRSQQLRRGCVLARVYQCRTPLNKPTLLASSLYVPDADRLR